MHAWCWTWINLLTVMRTGDVEKLGERTDWGEHDVWLTNTWQENRCTQTKQWSWNMKKKDLQCAGTKETDKSQTWTATVALSVFVYRIQYSRLDRFLLHMALQEGWLLYSTWKRSSLGRCPSGYCDGWDCGRGEERMCADRGIVMWALRAGIIRNWKA